MAPPPQVKRFKNAYELSLSIQTNFYFLQPLQVGWMISDLLKTQPAQPPTEVRL